MRRPLLFAVATFAAVLEVQAGRAVHPSDLKAAELAAAADRLMMKGDQSEAMQKYRSVVRAYPQSLSAPKAQLQIADLLAANHEHTSAFEAYQTLIDRFPASSLFTEAIEGQFAIVQRIADSYREVERIGAKPARSIPDRAALAGMLQRLLQNGRHTAFSPKLQYQVAIVLDRSGESRQAAAEFSRFLGTYSDDLLADDAAFQLGFLEYRVARENNRERSARERAVVAFEYFLSKFPQSEKAPEAAHLLDVLKSWGGASLQQAGRLYEKTGQSEAAIRTYNQAIESTADEAEAGKLAERIEALKKRMR